MNEHRRRRRQRDLENEIDRLWRLLGLPGEHKPSFDFASGNTIGIRADGTMGYFSFERGEKLSERFTDDASELLYWVVRDGLPAHEWLWERQAAALYALDPAWAERWCTELADRVGPEWHHEIPVLPPERPFVLRRPGSRPRRPRRRKPAPAGSARPGDPCEWCRPRPVEELLAPPRFRLPGR
ncbi:Immunity protein 63 [Streptomyces sp. TLI_053]|uniref:hypothetical protein n=1 Tax=Streptomyces sp. TLI_053 TaxID=1855352 RepID=UPI00087BEDCD|nr:hypothetical protein [Streptomyces sp. TLI_053]SDT79067.1 Immunity protein 63 [Streptomyces sp. TLI_053]